MVQFELTSPWQGRPGGPWLLRQALPAEAVGRWLQAAASATAQPVSRLAAGVLDLGEVLQAVAGSPLRAPIEATLGPSPWCNLSQSWLRHGRPAHHWHQDGALRFDFMAHPGQVEPPNALLPMLTCWIALTPCGHDAPGLEWVDSEQPRLLWPGELADTAVHERHPPQAFVRPRMQPGDALLFDGHLLHRTHLTEDMQGQRSSLELRFFPRDAWPTRLTGEQRMAWPVPPVHADIPQAGSPGRAE